MYLLRMVGVSLLIVAWPLAGQVAALGGGGGDELVAERRLREVWRSDPERFARENGDYLLARLVERRGGEAEARELYGRVAGRRSLLGGYALGRLAEMARVAGRVEEEREMLRRLLAGYPEHRGYAMVARRLSDSYLRARRYQEAIETLRRYGGPRRDSLVRLGEAQQGLGLADGARSLFESVLAGGSTDELSLRAVRGLDRLDGGRPGVLPEADRLRRARIFQFNRCFAEAGGHWQSLLRDYPASAARAEALFQLGRGAFLENRFAEAIEWYSRVAREFPESEQGEQGFYYVGHCYQGMGDADRAVARYEEFLAAYPRSSLAGYAHLNAIDTLRTAERFNEALVWARRLEESRREPFFIVTAIFSRVRIRLSRGEYAAALADLDLLRGRSLDVRGISATTNAAEVASLRVLCLQRLGRHAEAIEAALSIGEGRNGSAGYYGHRATLRLRDLEARPESRRPAAAARERLLTEARAASRRGDAAAAKSAATRALRFDLDQPRRGEMLAILRSAYARLRDYQLPPLRVSTVPRGTIAGELIALGLDDEGAAELAATGADPATVAFYCARGGCADLTLRFGDPILGALPADYRLELLPANWARIFYPLPYQELVTREAAVRRLDPLLLLSLARQESAFRQNAASSAAARGLFQFIAPTATLIAGQLGLDDFDLDDLFDPRIASRLAAHYVGNLRDEFRDPALVAAAYNGSEDSLRRWIPRARSSDLDLVVIEILKRETKDYVFRVSNYHRAYRQIHAP